MDNDLISAIEAMAILGVSHPISSSYFYILKKRFGKEELRTALRQGRRVYYSRKSVEALKAKGWTS
jgi:hypothetical protein